MMLARSPRQNRAVQHHQSYVNFSALRFMTAV